MLRFQFRLAVLLLLGFACAILATPAHAAAPRIIIIHGALLPRRVVLSDWYENALILGDPDEAANVMQEQLKMRPYLDVDMFWGTEWVNYVEQGKPLDALDPDDSNQHARLYPAVGSEEPLIAFDYIPGPGTLIRPLHSDAIKMLAKHGIPTRLDILPHTGSFFNPVNIPLLSLGAVFVLIGLASKFKPLLFASIS